MNSRVLDEMKADKVADVILVRKVFDRALRQRRRIWRLKRLLANGSIANETASVENEFEVLSRHRQICFHLFIPLATFFDAKFPVLNSA